MAYLLFCLGHQGGLWGKAIMVKNPRSVGVEI
jgi:hypothetical protein